MQAGYQKRVWFTARPDFSTDGVRPWELGSLALWPAHCFPAATRSETLNLTAGEADVVSHLEDI